MSALCPALSLPAAGPPVLLSLLVISITPITTAPFILASCRPTPYSYYLPPTVVANLPFFCTLHQVGFWTRAGMLDHLAGTHKFPLETAAYICPEDVEICLFPGY
jgi:hypothetical protein